MAVALGDVVCALMGHRFRVIERRHAATHRTELLGALGRCERCELMVDWREPSAGPRFYRVAP